MNTYLLLADFDLMAFLQGESFINALKSLGLAILVWIVGTIVINQVVKVITNAMQRAKMDASLRPFLISMIGTLLKVLLMLAVASTLGMEVTSFVAILSAAAFAVGMALQGGLANFAGGVMILVFKPFKIGDVIISQGFTGKVREIQIFNTILVTPDNQVIILPNGPVSNGPIQNITMEPTRRVDMTFGIGYGDDIQKAKEVIDQVLKSCPHITDHSKTAVFVSSLGDSSVNFAVRPWAATADYWAVHSYMQENIKLEFDRNNIGIPYPTMDVNVLKQDEN
ncbi:MULTISPECIES: mechanosensitive ion channel family protein [unclassified Aureispira]|uniref:mechanosensitive ion channel family protein n=1 Tax=unclassified Aureispira TaxID=2649989 RepID=UPI000AC7A096|nr:MULTISPECIES: mechanosensitive ion channel domain-containing protein [unclassified Aureispira]WMX13325.1 mechanosensitive ion channel [Aureispira sp. CCB-E]